MTTNSTKPGVYIDPKAFAAKSMPVGVLAKPPFADELPTAKVVPIAALSASNQQPDSKGGQLRIPKSLNYPNQVAQYLLDRCYRLPSQAATGGEHYVLCNTPQGLYKYTGTHWEPYSDTQLADEVYLHLDRALYVDDKGQETQRGVNTKFSLEVARGMIIKSQSSETLHEGNRHKLAFLNGTYDVNSGQFSQEHVPGDHLTYCLPFNYDPTASCPTWEKYLSETFGYDPGQIKQLQYLFGCVVHNYTDAHKIGYIYGPPRSGKSTILDLLVQLAGAKNTAAVNLNSLAKDFALEPLLGKTFAAVGDARTSGNSRNMVQNLLQISGGDPVTVNRKNKGILPMVKLSLVFFMVSNNPPTFSDSGGAMPNRLVIFHTQKGHLGNEDVTLKRRLVAELPGIANWALAGFQEFKQGGYRFVPTSYQQELLEDASEQAMPLLAFLSDCCEVTGMDCDKVEREAFIARFDSWCSRNNYNKPTKTEIDQQITAIEGISMVRPRTKNGQRLFYVQGVKLLPTPTCPI